MGTRLRPAAGKADPAEGFPYPLVVQDKDLRTLLEIKQPEQQPAAELRQVVAPAAAGGAADERIIVPTVRMLPATEQPDLLVREQEPPVVQRMLALEQPDVAGTSAAALAASAAWQSAELAVALDLPYIRYVQVGVGQGVPTMTLCWWLAFCRPTVSPGMAWLDCPV